MSSDSVGFVPKVSSSGYMLGLAFVLPKAGITITYVSISTVYQSMYSGLEALGGYRIHVVV